MSSKERVPQVWPDAVCMYAATRYEVTSPKYRGGRHVLGYGDSEEAAWQDAYFKLPASTEDAAPTVLMKAIGPHRFESKIQGAICSCCDQPWFSSIHPQPSTPSPEVARMETQRVQEICARLEAATPGPWYTYDGHVNEIKSCGGTVQCLEICSKGGRYASWIAQVLEKLAACDNSEGIANANFIAAAPDDIAYLLAQLREALATIKRLEGESAHWEDRCMTRVAEHNEQCAYISELEATIERLQQEHDFAGEILGKICLYGTLVSGEKPIDPPPHAAIDAILTQMERAEKAEATLRELHPNGIAQDAELERLSPNPDLSEDEYEITHEHRVAARKRFPSITPDSLADDIGARLEAVLERLSPKEGEVEE